MRNILNFALGLMLAFLLIVAANAWSAETMQACTQPDGSTVYTNKDVKGCSTIKLPELSTVPSLNRMPVYQAPVAVVPVEKPTVNSHVNDHLCSLYDEWMVINEETQGGQIFRGGPAQKIEYNTLFRIFSTGFISVNCR